MLAARLAESVPAGKWLLAAAARGGGAFAYANDCPAAGVHPPLQLPGPFKFQPVIMLSQSLPPPSSPPPSITGEATLSPAAEPSRLRLRRQNAGRRRA